jgi:hypothetical protein
MKLSFRRIENTTCKVAAGRGEEVGDGGRKGEIERDVETKDGGMKREKGRDEDVGDGWRKRGIGGERKKPEIKRRWQSSHVSAVS